jgi:hypothetical protein
MAQTVDAGGNRLLLRNYGQLFYVDRSIIIGPNIPVDDIVWQQRIRRCDF